MAAINWKTYDTGEIVTEIRQNRRYKLASPSTVTGAPSLAMQSATQFAIVYIYVDDVKLSTPLTISGTTKTPITINGQTPSKEELLTLSIEVGGIGNGEVIYTTDEPNGTPSNPFPSTAVPASGNYVGERIAVSNPAILPRGWSWLEWSGIVWFPPVGEPIAVRWADPIRSVTPGVTTQAEIYGGAGNTSPIIPDYMLPDGIIFKNEMCAGVATPTTASAYVLGFNVGGDISNNINGYNTHVANFGNTVPGGGVRGPNLGFSMLGKRSGAKMWGQGLVNLQSFDADICQFTPGNNRVWLSAKCGRTDDTVKLFGYRITSMGILQ